MVIIGILVAMLLPAIQSARESARQTDCKNRMRQFGLGILMYETSFGVFPPAATSSAPLHGVLSFVAPYLELGNISERVDYAHSWNQEGNDAFTKTDVSLFICPSAPGRTGHYATDYVPAYKMDSIVIDDFIDEGYTGPDPGAAGIVGLLELNGVKTSAQIRDGLSNTFMLVERAGQPVLYENGGEVGFSHFWKAWAGGKSPLSISELCDDGKMFNCKNGQEIYSFHPGGAVFLYGGGGVTFESETMDMVTFINRFTPSGGELEYR